MWCLWQYPGNVAPGRPKAQVAAPNSLLSRLRAKGAPRALQPLAQTAKGPHLLGSETDLTSLGRECVWGRGSRALSSSLSPSLYLCPISGPLCVSLSLSLSPGRPAPPPPPGMLVPRPANPGAEHRPGGCTLGLAETSCNVPRQIS